MSQQLNSGAESNHKAKILSILAESPNLWVQLGTLATIVLAGVGNFTATWQSSSINHRELEQAISEVHRIHDALRRNADEFRQSNDDARVTREQVGELKVKLDQLLKKQPP